MSTKHTSDRDRFDTEEDLYRAMGILLGVIDGMRLSRRIEGTLPETVWEGAISLLDHAARREFGTAWQPFREKVHAHFGAQDDRTKDTPE